MSMNKADYSLFDRPEILAFLFHPRPDNFYADSSHEVYIPVGNNIMIGAKLFAADKNAATILFFHGNGEIVSDYDELGPFYNSIGINFIPVDYRGYGKSTGIPTVSNMMSDCHVILNYTVRLMEENSFTGPLILMGRSLGSASVLELAANYDDKIDALIIESGFAYALPLLQLLGIDVEGTGVQDEFENNEKIKKFDKPTLIIHAEYDHIIPFSDGKTLYKASPADNKTFFNDPEC